MRKRRASKGSSRRGETTPKQEISGSKQFKLVVLSDVGLTIVFFFTGVALWIKYPADRSAANYAFHFASMGFGAFVSFMTGKHLK